MKTAEEIKAEISERILRLKAEIRNDVREYGTNNHMFSRMDGELEALEQLAEWIDERE